MTGIYLQVSKTFLAGIVVVTLLVVIWILALFDLKGLKESNDKLGVAIEQIQETEDENTGIIQELVTKDLGIDPDSVIIEYVDNAVWDTFFKVTTGEDTYKYYVNYNAEGSIQDIKKRVKL